MTFYDLQTAATKLICEERFIEHKISKMCEINTTNDVSCPVEIYTVKVKNLTIVDSNADNVYRELVIARHEGKI